MARAITDIEAEIRRLAAADQERLLRVLLEELDGPPDPDADRLWLEEAQRRSRELDAGLVKPVSGEEVFERARARLRHEG
jgi:hypothetical protein